MKKDGRVRQRLRASGVHRDIWRTNFIRSCKLSYNTLPRRKRRKTRRRWKIDDRCFKMLKQQQQTDKIGWFVAQSFYEVKTIFRPAFHQTCRRTNCAVNNPANVATVWKNKKRLAHRGSGPRQASHTSSIHHSHHVSRSQCYAFWWQRRINNISRWISSGTLQSSPNW